MRSVEWCYFQWLGVTPNCLKPPHIRDANMARIEPPLLPCWVWWRSDDMWQVSVDHGSISARQILSIPVKGWVQEPLDFCKIGEICGFWPLMGHGIYRSVTVEFGMWASSQSRLQFVLFWGSTLRSTVLCQCCPWSWKAVGTWVPNLKIR